MGLLLRGRLSLRVIPRHRARQRRHSHPKRQKQEILRHNPRMPGLSNPPTISQMAIKEQISEEKVQSCTGVDKKVAAKLRKIKGGTCYLRYAN